MISKDTHPVKQPPGTIRAALNAVLETSEGDMGGLTTEPGTVLRANPGIVRGRVNLTGNEFVLFIDEENGQYSIQLFDGETSKVLFRNSCLGFTTKVDARWRLRGCDRVVYFVQKDQPVRTINVDSPATSCEELALNRSFNWPTLDVEVVAGGNLLPGSYAFAFRYLDDSYNPTEWVGFTSPYNVTVGGGEYHEIRGAVPPEVDPEGQVSNKKIVVKSTRDDRFPFYQIAIIYYTSSQGDISAAYVTPPLSSPTFTLSGSLQGFTPISIQELGIEVGRIATAEHVEIYDQSLVLAGYTEAVHDYCSIQPLVNKITAVPIYETTPAFSPVPHDAKHPSQRMFGYMGGDIALFGIVFIYEDGSTTPVFPLAGQAPEAKDTATLTVAENDSATTVHVLDTNLQIGDERPAWTLRNTATRTSFGYYESANATYPETDNCEGGKVWGQMAGKPVRFYRFPDRNLLPVYKDGYLYHLGVEFDNIEYPEGAVSHYFVRAKLPSSLVETKGFVVTPTADPGPKTGVGNFTPEFFDLFPPDAWSRDELVYDFYYPQEDAPSGSIIALEREYYITDFNDDNQEVTIYETDGISLDGEDTLQLRFNHIALRESNDLARTQNLALLDQTQLSPRTTKTWRGRELTNASYNWEAHVLRPARPIPTQDVEHFYYASLRNATDGLNDLSALTWIAIGNPGETRVFGGDTTISEFTFVTVTTDGTKKNLFNQVKTYLYRGSMLGLSFIESRHNLSLRQDIKTVFSPEFGYLEGNDATQSKEYLVDRFTKRFGTGNELVLDPAVDELLLLNKDYRTDDRAFIPSSLPTNIDCCAKCLGKYPYRWAWSQPSVQERLDDPYRIFLPNNYRDMDGRYGPIEGLYVWQDTLLIFQTEALHVVPNAYQERVTDDGIITFIGATERPPEQMVIRLRKPEKWSICLTPEGVFFWDQGRPFLFNGRIRPLNRGVEKFFLPLRGEAVADYDSERERVVCCLPSTTFSVSLRMLDSYPMVSEHTYRVDWFLSGKDRFFHVADGIRSQDGEPLMFFDELHEFMVEQVAVSEGVVDWDSIAWVSYGKIGDVVKKEVTFTHAHFRNSHQATKVGELGTTFPMDFDMETWYAHGFRNEVSDYEETFDDLDPNVLQGNVWYEQEPFRDRYLIYRLVRRGEGKLTLIL